MAPKKSGPKSQQWRNTVQAATAALDLQKLARAEEPSMLESLEAAARREQANAKDPRNQVSGANTSRSSVVKFTSVKKKEPGKEAKRTRIFVEPEPEAPDSEVQWVDGAPAITLGCYNKWQKLKTAKNAISFKKHHEDVQKKALSFLQEVHLSSEFIDPAQSKVSSSYRLEVPSKPPRQRHLRSIKRATDARGTAELSALQLAEELKSSRPVSTSPREPSQNKKLLASSRSQDSEEPLANSVASERESKRRQNRLEETAAATPTRRQKQPTKRAQTPRTEKEQQPKLHEQEKAVDRVNNGDNPPSGRRIRSVDRVKEGNNPASERKVRPKRVQRSNSDPAVSTTEPAKKLQPRSKDAERRRHSDPDKKPSKLDPEKTPTKPVDTKESIPRRAPAQQQRSRSTPQRSARSVGDSRSVSPRRAPVPRARSQQQPQQEDGTERRRPKKKERTPSPRTPSPRKRSLAPKNSEASPIQRPHGNEFVLMVEKGVSDLGWILSGRAPGQVIVQYVYPGSWAAENFLQHGDELVSVDNKPVNTLSEIALGLAMEERPLSLQFVGAVAGDGQAQDVSAARYRKTTAAKIWEFLGAELDRSPSPASPSEPEAEHRTRSEQRSSLQSGKNKLGSTAGSQSSQSARTAQELKRGKSSSPDEKNIGSQYRQELERVKLKRGQRPSPEDLQQAETNMGNQSRRERERRGKSPSPEDLQQAETNMGSQSRRERERLQLKRGKSPSPEDLPQEEKSMGGQRRRERERLQLKRGKSPSPEDLPQEEKNTGSQSRQDFERVKPKRGESPRPKDLQKEQKNLGRENHREPERLQLKQGKNPGAEDITQEEKNIGSQNRQELKRGESPRPKDRQQEKKNMGSQSRQELEKLKQGKSPRTKDPQQKEKNMGSQNRLEPERLQQKGGESPSPEDPLQEEKNMDNQNPPDLESMQPKRGPSPEDLQVEEWKQRNMGIQNRQGVERTQLKRGKSPSPEGKKYGSQSRQKLQPQPASEKKRLGASSSQGKPAQQATQQRIPSRSPPRSARDQKSSPGRRTPRNEKSSPSRTPRSRTPRDASPSPQSARSVERALVRQGSSPTSPRKRKMGANRKQSPSTSPRGRRNRMLPRRRRLVNKKEEVKGSLLTIEPKDHILFDTLVGEDCRSTVKLTNSSAGAIAFKVKTTAPKKHHGVNPASGTIRPGGMQEVGLHLHAQGQPEAVKPSYSFFIQAVSLTKEGGKPDNSASDDDTAACDREVEVEEHRLIVIFKDIKRPRPVEKETTGVITLAKKKVSDQRDKEEADPDLFMTTNSIFTRLHADHDEKLQAMSDARRALVQQERQEAEELAQHYCAPHAPRWVVNQITRRLWEEAERKVERDNWRQELAHKAAVEMSGTNFSSNAADKVWVKFGRISFKEDQSHWERMVACNEARLRRLEEQRQRLKEEEEIWLAEHSVHKEAEGLHTERFEMLYEDSKQREIRLQASLELEAQRDAESFVHAHADVTANVDEATHRLYEDAFRRRNQQQIVQKEIDNQMLKEMHDGEIRPGVQDHVERLYMDALRRQRFIVLLRERWETAHMNMLHKDSVHRNLPKQLTEEHVDSITQRLYPEVAPVHQDFLMQGDGEKYKFTSQASSGKDESRRSSSPLSTPRGKNGGPVTEPDPQPSPERGRNRRGIDPQPSPGRGRHRGPASEPDPQPSPGRLGTSSAAKPKPKSPKMSTIQDPLLMGKFVDEGATRASLPNDPGESF